MEIEPEPEPEISKMLGFGNPEFCTFFCHALGHLRFSPKLALASDIQKRMRTPRSEY